MSVVHACVGVVGWLVDQLVGQVGFCVLTFYVEGRHDCFTSTHTFHRSLVFFPNDLVQTTLRAETRATRTTKWPRSGDVVVAQFAAASLLLGGDSPVAEFASALHRERNRDVKGFDEAVSSAAEHQRQAEDSQHELLTRAEIALRLVLHLLVTDAVGDDSSRGLCVLP